MTFTMRQGLVLRRLRVLLFGTQTMVLLHIKLIGKGLLHRFLQRARME